MSPLVKLQAYFTKSDTPLRMFLTFLNCTNGTKSRNASLWKLTVNDKVILDTVLK